MSWTTGCPTGKRSFPTRKEAHRVGKKIEGEHMRAYPCERCAQWHLGHVRGAYLRGEGPAQRQREQTFQTA